MTRLAKSVRVAARGALRTGVLRGREHLVLPVVALVEGVLFASNATNPELVLAEEFSKAPLGWNGRPVMMDHPSLAGQKTSANEPTTLERLQIGTVFHTAVSDKKLEMEAWLDPELVEQVEGAKTLVERIKGGETVEVSVGVFVVPEEASGQYKGKQYADIWREIVPDHLAILPEGVAGACSIEMGCGTPRVASAGEEEKVADKKGKKLWERFMALKAQFVSSADEVSDNEIRQALNAALFAEVPGYLGVEAVYAESKTVIYAVAPEGDIKFFKRAFADVTEGVVTWASSPEEVKQVTSYEPVVASAGDGPSDSKPIPVMEASMNKKERIAAIIASGKTCFTAADSPILEQFTEERLAAMEQHVSASVPAPVVPEVKVLTPEEEQAAFFSKYPEFQRIVTEHVAAASAKKMDLVTRLKVAQMAFTEAELNVKSPEELEKLMTLTAKPDFSGVGTPRAAASDEGVPKPPDMRERILALRNKKVA